MKLIKKSGNAIVTLSIKGDDWTKTLKQARKDELANLEVKGFRKGNVPANIAKKYISESKVRQNAANKAIDNHYAAAIELITKENVISRPSIDIIKISDEEIEVTFTSALMPEIKLGKTSGFESKIEEVKVTEEEVEKEMSQIKPMLVKQVEFEGKVANGQIANIDFLGKKDGVEFEGGEAKGFDLKIGSGQFIPGFEDKIIGMKVNEEKVLELTFPEQYPSQDLAGADVTFNVKINSIKEEKTLEGEELKDKLKSMGFKSESDMKTKIEKMVEERKVQQAKDRFFEAAVQEIIDHKSTEIILPKVLLKDEIENQLNQFKQTIKQQGLNIESYLEMIGKDLTEFKNKDLAPQAEKRMKHGLIYTKLIEELKVEVNDKEIKAELQKIADAQGMKLEEVEKVLPVQNIKSALTFSKLVDILLK